MTTQNPTSNRLPIWLPRIVLAAAAPLWVTTEKDAVKLPVSWVAPAEVLVLSIAFAPAEPGALLDWIEAKLR